MWALFTHWTQFSKHSRPRWFTLKHINLHAQPEPPAATRDGDPPDEWLDHFGDPDDYDWSSQ